MAQQPLNGDASEFVRIINKFHARKPDKATSAAKSLKRLNLPTGLLEPHFSPGGMKFYGRYIPVSAK